METPPAELIQVLSEQFDALCQQRHELGAEKYGPFSFLEKDMVEEAIAEVVDLSNYARYMFIKLKLLQQYGIIPREGV